MGRRERAEGKRWRGLRWRRGSKEVERERERERERAGKERKNRGEKE